MLEDLVDFIKVKFYRLFPNLLEDDAEYEEYQRQLVKDVEKCLISRQIAVYIRNTDLFSQEK